MDTRFLGHRPLLSGRRVTVGPLLPITAPLANDYDPALFEGAVAYGSDRQFYYSDGVDWIVPSEDVVIARPSALVPTTAFEQMQLRLTQFYSPAGLSQIGARFEVAASEDGFGDPLFSRTLTGEVSSYTTLYPEDGMVPGQAFWWRALYQGTEGQQSDWSTPFRQVYPAFITNPAPVTRDGITSGTVEITPFESAFGFLYTETQVEFFAPGDPGTVIASVTEVGGPAVVIPSSLAEGQEYLWRARYGGRPNQAGAVSYTDWTAKRSVFNGAASIVLVYDPNLALDRTIRLPLGLESTIAVVNVTVDWGDGTSETVTSRGTRAHQYAPEVAGPVTVTISGTLTHYGGDVDQTGLVRVDSFGFKLGLVSLRRALARVSPALGVVNARIPPQVSDVSQMFLRAALDPALDISQMQFPGVTTMAGMFERAAFNGDLSGWDVSGVTNMAGMFRYATFNNDSIAGWDIASVTDLSHAFAGSGNGVLVQMNPDISAWNPASVTSMFMMFADNTTFNRPIGGWETSACTDFRRMFYNAEAFNQPLTDWDMAGATSLNQMFNRADAFNGDLSGWDVSNVTDMTEMFSYSSSYSGDLSAWDVSSVTDMTAMFRSVEVDLDLRGWDVRQVRSMASMFNSNTTGRLQVSTWQPLACEDFSDMFYRCFAFDDDISGWDVSAGRDLSRMLFRCALFNAPIQNWDVSSAETLSGMLVLS